MKKPAPSKKAVAAKAKKPVVVKTKPKASTKVAPKAKAPVKPTKPAAKSTKKPVVVKKTSTKAKPKAKIAPKAGGAFKTELNRTALIGHLVEATGSEKKVVTGVVNALEDVMLRSLHPKGLGYFTMPGLFKVQTIRKPATKARKGINPFTKEPCVFKAKPASIRVKVRPLTKLRKAASGD